MARQRTEEQAAAEAMLTRIVAAWNQADGAAYGDGYWPDAELVDPAGTIHTGRAAITRSPVELWAGSFHGSHIQGALRRLRQLGPDCLLVDLNLEVTGFQQRPPAAPRMPRTSSARASSTFSNGAVAPGASWPRRTPSAPDPEPKEWTRSLL